MTARRTVAELRHEVARAVQVVNVELPLGGATSYTDRLGSQDRLALREIAFEKVLEELLANEYEDDDDENPWLR